MPAIPALGKRKLEAESKIQGYPQLCNKFKASLGYTKPCHRKEERREKEEAKTEEEGEGGGRGRREEGKHQTTPQALAFRSSPLRSHVHSPGFSTTPYLR